MSVTTYELDFLRRYPLEELYRAIMADCRCVKEVQMLQPSPDRACCRVQVTRIDAGVWEWNDEVLA